MVHATNYDNAKKKGSQEKQKRFNFFPANDMEIAWRLKKAF